MTSSLPKFVEGETNVDAAFLAETYKRLKLEQIIKSGYLEKKGETVRSWKTRWFVLRTTRLTYYKDDKEYQVLKVIDLKDVSMVAEVLVKHPNVFAVVSPSRTWYLQAQNRKDMEEWIASIKLVLRELHKNDPNLESHQIPLPQQTVLLDQVLQTMTRNPRSSSRGREGLSRQSSSKETMDMAGVGRGISSPELPLQDRGASSPSVSPQLSPTGGPHSDNLGLPSPPLRLDYSSSEDEEPSRGHTRSRSKHEAEDHFAVVGGNDLGLEAEENNVVLWQGYMDKLGKTATSWKRRYMVLKNGRIYVYDTEKDNQFKRVIPVTDILSIFPKPPMIERAPGEAPWAPLVVSARHPYCVRVVHPKRTVTMAADSEEELISFISALYAVQQRVLERRTVRNQATAVLPPEPVVHGYAETTVSHPLRSLAITSTPGRREGETLVEFVPGGDRIGISS